MSINSTVPGKQVYEFRISPLLMFCIPPSRPGFLTYAPDTTESVELVVTDLEDFCVPDADLPRIEEALQAALGPHDCP